MWRILVVDDNFVNRKLIIEVLKGQAECDIAATGKEAIEAYDLSIENDEPYDLILLDISMPEMDGMAVLEYIRKNELSSGIDLGEGIPIIMVTAYQEPFEAASQKGCDDYILKPIQPETLVSKIKARIPHA
jgi:two-component system chemotaxis response regulator CheY